MKNHLLKFSLVCMALVFALSMDAKVVTLVIGKDKPTAEISIGTHEVAEVISSFDSAFGSTGGSAPHFTMTVTSQNQTFILDGSNLPPGRGIIVIAGEAKIRIAYGGTAGPYSAFVTLQITPESFPPDKTLIIPADSKGANIIMEQSTDLINWSASLPGAYTNMTNNLFFRIRAERIP